MECAGAFFPKSAEEFGSVFENCGKGCDFQVSFREILGFAEAVLVFIRTLATFIRRVEPVI